MIQLKAKHQEIIHSILSKHPYKFYAYGSRAKQQAEEYSDLDLCYREDIPWNVLSIIHAELEESDLPFKVDLVAWNWMDSYFQKSIERDLILFALD